MMYPLVRDLAAEGIPVVVTCRVLGFSPQGFYRWGTAPCSRRDRDDARLTNAIVDVHAEDPEFGDRFIADALHAAGHRAGARRVWRLCSQHRVFSTTTRKGRQAAGKRPGPAVHDDLVQRHFTAPQPNALWLTDITEHPTAEGKLYLCAIKDGCSQRIVGYAIGSHMTARLATTALRVALARRRPGRVVIVHSERGSQGELNWSSQHLDDGGVVDGDDERAAAAGAAVSGTDRIAWGADGGVAGGSCPVLGGDCARREDRSRGSRRGRVIPGRVPVVSARWGCEPWPSSDRVGPFPVVLRA